MTELYSPPEPHDAGMLDLGGGALMHWEVSGAKAGRPAVVFHGGPGSGLSASLRRVFDPTAYRVAQFDQRGCGRSAPHASDPRTDLSTNDTRHLIADAERLRAHLRVERWLVLGGSWGSTLALAYAEAHPERVTGLVLFGVTTGRHSEWDWTFRGGIARFYPEQWARLRSAVGAEGDDVLGACERLVASADAAERRRAAEAWCRWESAIARWPPRDGLAPRFRDEAYAVAFTRLVMRYARAYGFIEDGALLQGAHALARTPGIIVSGGLDLQAPPENAWHLKRAWPGADLVTVDAAGHAPGPAVLGALVDATDRLR
ncbi:MAG TPA: alpha/beta fold hydrolase [Candidatus Limnocylindria bacterium]|nr:alpha/beta fold hydrolase [Candidatus Limnocylindria bacterium]